MNKVVIHILFFFLFAWTPFASKAQTARWVIKPQYTSITPFDAGLYKVKSGSSVGIVDNDGKIIVPIYADSITSMIDHCALVLQYTAGKYKLKGILQDGGNFVSITEELYVGDYPFFSEGKLPVYNSKDRYGYIDPNGKQVISFDYSAIHPFSEGWAAVCKGKGLLQKGMVLIKKSKEKVFYINERAQLLVLQSDIGDIYSGTSFKNGEALVTTKDGKYCFINTSGRLVRIDNNVTLAFDEKYALQSGDNKADKSAAPAVVYDGPTTFSENNLYGYKQESKIVLPAQFQEAMPFSGAYAIVLKDNKYGVLKLSQESFECRSMPGTLKTTTTGMESVDYVVSVPNGWQDTSLELFCVDSKGNKTSCVRPGDANKSRVFSFVLPKGNRKLSLDSDNLIVWESAMGDAVSGSSAAETEMIGVSISPTTVKANIKNNASIVITLTNNTADAISFTVKISGDRLKVAGSQVLTLKKGQSKKISAYFTNVVKEESRTVRVSTSVMENNVNKRIQLLPFFTDY